MRHPGLIKRHHPLNTTERRIISGAANLSLLLGNFSGRWAFDSGWVTTRKPSVLLNIHTLPRITSKLKRLPNVENIICCIFATVVPGWRSGAQPNAFDAPKPKAPLASIDRKISA